MSSPPFPYRMNKKEKNRKFSKFMAMLKELLVIFLLVEALEQRWGYVKFRKDLLTKKRMVMYELVDNIHYYSVIATRSLVQKKFNLGTFTISCTISTLNFAKALCGLRVRTNLIPLGIYK